MEPGQFVKSCTLDDLKADGPTVRSLLGKKVGLFSRDDGSVYALEMTCKHQGADLSGGKVEDGVVTCPRHGWTYDLETGKCLSHPTGLPLRFHEVKVDGEDVLVSLVATPSPVGAMPWDVP